MTVYIAILEDRHIDVQAEVFTTAEKAIAYAKAFMLANAAYPDEIEEDPEIGIYHATYSSEGDCVSVVESELDPEWEDA
jgi:hypothetical protein